VTVRAVLAVFGTGNGGKLLISLTDAAGEINDSDDNTIAIVESSQVGR
jgi:hypothetical protein